MIDISSTNRSNARESHKADYYVTPIDKIMEFLDEFNKLNKVLKNNGIKILDCCAGGDEVNPMSYPEALNQFGVDKNSISTIDIREDSLADTVGDFINMEIEKGKYDVIITNPPFNLAREIIEKALEVVKDDGYVIMLLRLNYYGGQLRKDMWDNQMPEYSFVHNRRISFTPDGKTDSIEYQHCVWRKGYYPEFTKLKVI